MKVGSSPMYLGGALEAPGPAYPSHSPLLAEEPKQGPVSVGNMQNMEKDVFPSGVSRQACLGPSEDKRIVMPPPVSTTLTLITRGPFVTNSPALPDRLLKYCSDGRPKKKRHEQTRQFVPHYCSPPSSDCTYSSKQSEHILCPAWNLNAEWDHPEPIPSRDSPKF